MASLAERLRYRLEIAFLRFRMTLWLIAAGLSVGVMILGINAFFYPRWLQYLPGQTPPNVVADIAAQAVDLVVAFGVPSEGVFVGGILVLVLTNRIFY